MNRKKISTPFGERLKKVRGLKSQVEFAASLGITQRAVVNYETGGRIPRGNILRKICEQYGINEEWLLTGDGPMALQGTHAKLAGGQSVLSVLVDGKMGDMSPILPQESKQPIGNIGSEKDKMGDMSPILPQTLTSRCLRLADENAALLRENGDLRVEVERLKNQLNQAKKARPNDDALLAKLVQENKDLRARLKRFERAGLVVPPLTDIAQNGLPERK